MARKWLSVLLIMCLVVGVMMPAALADDSNETFIVVSAEDPKSFNPDAQADDYGWPIFQNIFDGLFQLNWNNEIVPNLCETYTISDDGLTYTFNLRKGVKWHDGEPFTSADVEFTFQMIEAGATEPVATATNGASGSVSFGGITFTQPGTYTYEISEVPGVQSNGVSYDRSVYTATAVVTDTGTGTLSVEWTVKNAAGEEVEQIEFANGYTATPASATFGGSKVLNGATLEDGQFSFRLSDAEGNEVQTVQNAADGSFVFDTLTFDAPGTYEYTISEVLPEDDDATTDGIQQDGVTYDEATWTVEVTVSDNRKGQLTITGLTYNGETEFPVFTNTYTEPPAPEPDDDNEGPLMQTSDDTFTAIAAVLGLGVVSIAAGVAMKKRGE